jgi:hypothetical protein
MDRAWPCDRLVQCLLWPVLVRQRWLLLRSGAASALDVGVELLCCVPSYMFCAADCSATGCRGRGPWHLRPRRSSCLPATALAPRASLSYFQPRSDMRWPQARRWLVCYRHIRRRHFRVLSRQAWIPQDETECSAPWNDRLTAGRRGRCAIATSFSACLEHGNPVPRIAMHP